MSDVTTLSKKHARSRRHSIATVAASFVWLGLWSLAPVLLGAWCVLFLLYAASLGGFGLAETAGLTRNDRFLAWRNEFLRSADIFVLSGFLALTYVVLFVLALAWYQGRELFPQ